MYLNILIVNWKLCLKSSTITSVVDHFYLLIAEDKDNWCLDADEHLDKLVEKNWEKRLLNSI